MKNTDRDKGYIEFTSGLVEFINYFNLLESNIGLMISRLSNPDDSRQAYSQIGQMSFDNKIHELKKLLTESDHLVSEEKKDRFACFIKKLDKQRKTRNLFLHCHWTYIATTKQLEIGIPPWFSKTYKSEKNRMELTEFHSAVNEMEQLFYEYMLIHKELGYI